MSDKNSQHLNLAKQITKQFRAIEQVDAIILGGSLTGKQIDHYSDIDLYIFSDGLVPLKTRENIVKLFGASKANLGLTFWGNGDEWIHKETGIEIDLIYWNKNWIEDQLSNLLDKYQASVGYSTSFWHTIQNSHILYDRTGWFAKFQSRYKIPYPPELKEAIILKNYPLLKDIIPSYYNQIKKAIERSDLISVNHRVAVFLASYFDIIFALNEITNPGEKKIIPFVYQNCSKIPDSLDLEIEKLLKSPSYNTSLLSMLDKLIEKLNTLLMQEGFHL